MDEAFKEKLVQFVQWSLKEDVGDGDHTSLSSLPIDKQGEAKLLVKEEGSIAGVDVAVEIFRIVDAELEVQVFIRDGSKVHVGDIVLFVKGKIHSILKAERLVLNVMQRMSAIATKTASYVRALQGTSTRVLDTRKTTPLLRFLEKKSGFDWGRSKPSVRLIRYDPDQGQSCRLRRGHRPGGTKCPPLQKRKGNGYSY